MGNSLSETPAQRSKRNLSGNMTRKEVYGGSLLFFLASLAMTTAAIIIPEWINWEPDVPPPAEKVKYTYGLHTRCTTLTQTCTPFPAAADCLGDERNFCTLWRTTGFLMSAAFALQLACLAAFAILIFGGKQKCVHGWRLLSPILLFVVALQAGAAGVVAGLLDRDGRFVLDGWVLGRSWALCVASWGVQLLIVGVVVGSRFVLAEEGGYELIPDRPW